MVPPFEAAKITRFLNYKYLTQTKKIFFSDNTVSGLQFSLDIFFELQLNY